MARPGATHRAAAPSCTPATRDRTGRLHRDVHGRPAACRNPGLLDDSRLASASRPDRPGTAGTRPAARPSRNPVPEPGGIRASRPGFRSPLRRDPRSAPPPGGRPPCGRHGGRGRQRTTAIQEDPVGGMRVSEVRRRCYAEYAAGGTLQDAFLSAPFFEGHRFLVTLA